LGGGRDHKKRDGVSGHMRVYRWGEGGGGTLPSGLRKRRRKKITKTRKTKGVEELMGGSAPWCRGVSRTGRNAKKKEAREVKKNTHDRGSVMAKGEAIKEGGVGGT